MKTKQLVSMGSNNYEKKRKKSIYPFIWQNHQQQPVKSMSIEWLNVACHPYSSISSTQHHLCNVFWLDGEETSDFQVFRSLYRSEIGIPDYPSNWSHLPYSLHLHCTSGIPLVKFGSQDSIHAAFWEADEEETQICLFPVSSLLSIIFFCNNKPMNFDVQGHSHEWDTDVAIKAQIL